MFITSIFRESWYTLFLGVEQLKVKISHDTKSQVTTVGAGKFSPAVKKGMRIDDEKLF